MPHSAGALRLLCFANVDCHPAATADIVIYVWLLASAMVSGRVAYDETLCFTRAYEDLRCPLLAVVC